jgi:hypothetical protein
MLRKSVFVAALALLPALALSQPRQGDWELTLAAAGQSDRDLSNGSIGVHLGVGQFVTDQILLSVRHDSIYADSPGVGHTHAHHTRVAADYHFDLDVWQPFVGAHFGFQYGPARRDAFTAGAQGGVKYYVASRTFIYGLAEYTFALRGGGNRVRRGAWGYSAGLGFNW